MHEHYKLDKDGGLIRDQEREQREDEAIKAHGQAYARGLDLDITSRKLKAEWLEWMAKRGALIGSFEAKWGVKFQAAINRRAAEQRRKEGWKPKPRARKGKREYALTPEQCAEAKARREKGETATSIARSFSVSRKTLDRGIERGVGCNYRAVVNNLQATTSATCLSG